MSIDTPGAAGRVRASDAERERYAERVRDAVGDGRLTLPEGDERLAAIYASRFRDELAPFTSDLPGPENPPERGVGPGYGPGSGRGPRHRPPWAPEAHPPRRGAFAGHLLFVVLVSSALIGIWALSGSGFFWPAIPLVFFALGLVRHARWAGRRHWSR